MQKTTTAPLDAKIADKLLDLLSTDDEFREHFQRDHLSALRAIGHMSPQPEKVTACGLALSATQPEPFRECKVRQLASKESIAAARNEIRSMLLQGLDQTTPQLDTGTASVHVFKIQ